MAYVLGDWAQPIGYLSLGLLFFAVVWNFAEQVIKDMFPNPTAGRLFAMLLATYGFWYPFWQPMRWSYMGLLSFVALSGTALSRLGMLARMTRRGRTGLTMLAIGLVIIDFGQIAVTAILKLVAPYQVVAELISWVLLVYGMTGEVRPELLGPVTRDFGLPHVSFLQGTFILASVMFLPIELPVIDVLMSLTAIIATVSAWYFFVQQTT
ncbi:MAG: hypothetical protein Kow00123_17820 [Anaerolineales bacterium]